MILNGESKNRAKKIFSRVLDMGINFKAGDEYEPGMMQRKLQHGGISIRVGFKTNSDNRGKFSAL